MSVILDFVAEKYSDIVDEIKDIDNEFFRAVTFLILWAIMLFVILSVIMLTLFKSYWWGLSIVIAIILFEILCLIGRALDKPELKIKD